MDMKKLGEAGIVSLLELPTWAELLKNTAVEYEIDKTPQRLNMWLAQISFESGQFSHLEENLNYSAERLLQVFPHLFTLSEARMYAFHPQQIGSRIYGGRFGNGDERTGDGYLYRGRGLIQLTFKSNYRSFGRSIGMEEQILAHPELLSTPQYAAQSAGWFWKLHGCNELADAGDFEGVTRKINGGLNGYLERQKLYATITMNFGEGETQVA